MAVFQVGGGVGFLRPGEGGVVKVCVPQRTVRVDVHHRILLQETLVAPPESGAGADRRVYRDGALAQQQFDVRRLRWSALEHLELDPFAFPVKLGDRLIKAAVSQRS